MANSKPRTQNLELEVQLQRKLDLSRIGDGIENFAERSQRRRSDAGARVGEVGVIEGVEEFAAELYLPALCDQELFEQAQVDVFQARPMERARGTVTEGPR